MEVKLIIARASPTRSYSAGQIIEVSDEEGKRLIELGKAEPVKKRGRQTATAPEAETDA